jgi:adenylosuccinate synthase
VIEKVLRANQYLAERYEAPAMAADAIAEEMVEQAQVLRPIVMSAYEFLAPVRAGAWTALLEGAQGTLLDVDHGTYPYVTSSNCTVGGALTGTGLAPQRISSVCVVMKAYCTRVGNGPFPTELHGDEAEALRQAGHEFGATTGRPRRPGWFDAMAGKYAVDINGATEIALTKLDVLSGMESIKVATGYVDGGAPVDFFPADAGRLERCRPVYSEFPGWEGELAEAKGYAQLPENARRYIETLEELMGCRIRYVSTGPARDQFLDRGPAQG